MGDRTSLTLYEGMTGMMENAFINVKNRSHSITAEVRIPRGGGEGTIFVNGKKLAAGRIDKTTPFVYSADETADVGVDEATPVTEAYKERDNEFNGNIEKVTITLK